MKTIRSFRDLKTVRSGRIVRKVYNKYIVNISIV